VLVSTEFSDDAAVVRPMAGSDEALVLTADVIAPLVDDAETFGAIAATNSISDVYAMGGRPQFALNLVFFPNEALPMSVLDSILAGAAKACQRMGVAVVGGHTVRDVDVKFGLSVTGVVRVDEVLSNRTARAGQALVLTKAIGTGVIGTAIKNQHASDEEAAAAIESMTTPNASALAIARRHGVTACTDVTGFGLLGHLRNILRGSDLVGELELAAMPLLPGAHAHASAGRVPGGSKANLAYLEDSLVRVGDEDELLTLLAADAQTSGGLLLCVPAEKAADLTAELRDDGLAAATVGRLALPDGDSPVGTIRLRY
jgi:selenide,water dikinase